MSDRDETDELTLTPDQLELILILRRKNKRALAIALWAQFLEENGRPKKAVKKRNAYERKDPK